jgi:cysteinyl-tRNA synthetase
MVLHELLDKHPPEVLRYLLLKAHYRQPLDWSDSALKQARTTLDGWYGVLRDLGDIDAAADLSAIPTDIEDALLDDLNTPEAFAALARLADAARAASTPDAKRAAKSALLSAGELLGLLGQTPDEWFKGSMPGVEIDAAEVEQLLTERAAAKKARDFAAADRIRDRLQEMGVAIEDTPQGTRWKLAKNDECPA